MERRAYLSSKSCIVLPEHLCRHLSSPLLVLFFCRPQLLGAIWFPGFQEQVYLDTVFRNKTLSSAFCFRTSRWHSRLPEAIRIEPLPQATDLRFLYLWLLARLPPSLPRHCVVHATWYGRVPFHSPMYLQPAHPTGPENCRLGLSRQRLELGATWMDPLRKNTSSKA